MKEKYEIIRNGETISLTWSEMHTLFRRWERNYHREDIESAICEEEWFINMTEEEKEKAIEGILEEYEDNLMYDEMWHTYLNKAINDYYYYTLKGN